MPTQKRLRELFDYQPDTGLLLWKHLTFKKSREGKPAGFYDAFANRYTVSLNGKLQYLHRVIWTLLYGAIPTGMVIDHIDHDATNNKLNNLRLVTRKQNTQNRGRLSVLNRSGALGVYWHSQCKRWTAQICVNGVRIHLGLFDTVEDAKAAYETAKLAAGFHPNHGHVIQSKAA